MAVPLRQIPQVEALMRRLQGVPAWALLSLALNGLLFIAVLVVLRQMAVISDSGLPQANAFAADGDPAAETPFTPQLGDRHYLKYQQWVALLQQEANAIAAQNAPRQTVLLGDSLSLWFPAELLPGRRTWLNQGISGENSAGLRQRLTVLDATQPETIFIMIGINDLIWGTAEDEVIRNVRDSVAYLQQAHPEATIVIQSVLPHGGEAATWEGKDRLIALPIERIQTVNQSLKALASESGTYYLDLYPLFANGEGYLRSDLSTDGLHLNRQGYLVWRSAIALFNETDLVAQ